MTDRMPAQAKRTIPYPYYRIRFDAIRFLDGAQNSRDYFPETKPPNYIALEFECGQPEIETGFEYRNTKIH